MPEATKKMLDQLLDEAGKDILLSGAMVVDRTTASRFPTILPIPVSTRPNLISMA